MKRNDLVAIHAELVAERVRRRKMTPAQRQHHDALRDLPINAARQRTDPEATAKYVAKLGMRLRGGEDLPGGDGGEDLPGDVRRWLGDALIEAALNPAHAGAALGLVRRRARPKSPPARVREALAIVAELQAKGVPLRDNVKQDGALSIAAKRTGLNESAILRQRKPDKRRKAGRSGNSPDIPHMKPE